MTASFPTTHYACPCSDLTSAPLPTTSKRASIQPTTFQLAEDQAFDPHSPRANFALYPLDHLLYCDECDAVRCPRCWTEEVLYWYCPSCLFEVPSSAVRGDGNRCSRSCYECPSCAAPLAVTQIPKSKDDTDTMLKPGDAASSGSESYAMQCHYCEWSSLEIDVQFSRPTKITEQLNKLRKARSTPSAPIDSKAATPEIQVINPDEIFTSLSNFYKEQLGESGDPQNPYSNSPYSSPANLARIMSLYGGLSYNALKKSREKPQPMREALFTNEGFQAFTSDDSDSHCLSQMRTVGLDGTTTIEQRFSSPANNDARFTEQLWPSATRLRTRRGKRCKTCRQFLARPEPKVGSVRYKIRLLALNHIPRLSIRPFHPTAPPTTTNPAFNLRTDTTEQEELRPHQTKQYILTIRNPIFENVKITLGTPATTPGKVASKITILCPSFTVGPAGDVWDEALSTSTSTASDGSRKAAMASLTGSSESGERQAEAGKVWEKTRNSTSVIVEVVPGSLPSSSSFGFAKPDDASAAEELEEDDDVLEVPIYVRAEWEAEAKPGESLQAKKDLEKQPGEKVKKELGYWVVLGVGRIAL